MRATFKTLFYVNRSKEAREINFALDDIKAQIIKHYQRLSDREAYVTAEMVRNAFRVSATSMKRSWEPSTRTILPSAVTCLSSPP